ncbi:MAG: restriction endonuclease subunit S [Desulfuromonadales bacterium]|nr:restriction endonuclease subunit S [Desulfuromonadales bacterium]
MSYKPYSKYKASGVEWIGEIPEGWSATRVKRLAELRYGDSLRNEIRQEGEVPVFGSNGVVGSHNAAITKAPCIIVGRKGSFGKVNYSTKECFPIDTTYFIDSTSTSHDLKFLYYLLGTLDLDSISKDTGVPGLSREEAYEKTALVPPHELEPQIATFLDRKTAQIDNLIEIKRKQIELLKEERTAIINQAVTKGLNPDAKMKESGIEWIGEIPEGWEVKPLKREIEFLTSGSRGWARHYSEDGKIFIRIGNLTRNSVDLDLSDIQYVTPPEGTEGVRTKVQDGDLLISITAYLGSIAIVNKELPEAFVSQHVALARPLTLTTTPKWLGYTILSRFGKSQLEMQGYGGTKVQLSLDDVNSLNVLVPPTTEQNAIIKFLENKIETIDDSISQAEQQIQLLQEYRTTLISDAVTGKIDIREEAA